MCILCKLAKLIHGGGKPRTRRKKTTAAQRQEMRELRASGIRLKEIARLYKVSIGTVCNVCK